MCGYLCYCDLHVSFDQSGPSPLTSLIRHFYLQNCCSLDVYLFFAPFSANYGLLHVKSQEIRQFLRIFKPPCLAPTIIPRSKSLRSHFFPIWSEKQLNLLNTSAYFYAFSCCHMIGWLNCINKLVYTVQVCLYRIAQLSVYFNLWCSILLADCILSQTFAQIQW